MLSRNRRAILAATAAGALVLVLPTTAVADHETRPHKQHACKGPQPTPRDVPRRTGRSSARQL